MYYFDGGLKLTVGGRRYRISFLEPAGSGSDLSGLYGLARNLSAGRRAGVAWRAALAETLATPGKMGYPDESAVEALCSSPWQPALRRMG